MVSQRISNTFTIKKMSKVENTTAQQQILVDYVILEML